MKQILTLQRFVNPSSSPSSRPSSEVLRPVLQQHLARRLVYDKFP